MSKYSNLKQNILANGNCPKIISDNGTINININDTTELLSPYAEDNRAVISNDFAEFLNNSVKDVSPKQDITINITSKQGTIDNIQTAIKSYYYNEFIDIERKLKFNLLASIITFIIGLIAIAISIIQYVVNLPVLAGAIDVFAWVFMWEAFDLFFFRRTELKHQQLRYANFINATINLK